MSKEDEGATTQLTKAQEEMVERTDRRLRKRGEDYFNLPLAARARRIVEQTSLPLDLVIGFLAQADARTKKITFLAQAEAAAARSTTKSKFGKIKGLTMMHMAVGAHAEKSEDPEQENATADTELVGAEEMAPAGPRRHASGSSRKTAANLGTIKGLVNLNIQAHAAQQELRRASEPPPRELVRAASAAVCRADGEGPDFLERCHCDFLEELIQNQLAKNNEVDNRPYARKAGLGGPVFSYKAHLKHRVGLYSFGMLAALATKNRPLEDAAKEITSVAADPRPPTTATTNVPTLTASAPLSTSTTSAMGRFRAPQRRKRSLSESDLPALVAAAGTMQQREQVFEADASEGARKTTEVGRFRLLSVLLRTGRARSGAGGQNLGDIREDVSEGARKTTEGAEGQNLGETMEGTTAQRRGVIGRMSKFFSKALNPC